MKLWRHAAQWPDRLLDRLFPPKAPDFFKAQPPPLATLLPYEAMLPLERPSCLLADGGMGVMWELTPLEHEVLAIEALRKQTTLLAEAIAKISDQDVAIQLIFDAEPAPSLSMPEGLEEPRFAAEKILHDRMQAVSRMAIEPKDSQRLMRRRVFLCLRLAGRGSLAQRLGSGDELVRSTQELKALGSRLMRLASELEMGIGHAGLTARVVGEADFIALLRTTLHGLDEREALTALPAGQSESRLAEQILRDFVVLTPHAVGVGTDSWEICSWADQPPVVYPGLLANLMQVDVPHRLVVNICPASDTADLATKASLLKNASDAFGELQRSEVRWTQDALVRGESLMSVSMHLLVRNRWQEPASLAKGGQAKAVCTKVHTLTRIPWIIEKHAAPALFLLALPFGYTAAAQQYCGRERRVLSRNLAPYLPVFGPFSGCKSPLQLMVSRGGSAVWLNPFDSETSPHMALLASSGAGKSFFAQNLMMSFFAKHARGDKPPMMFVIDKKTSYEIFARVIGEDFGAEIIKPPGVYPNIFRGRLDEYRLPVIIGIIKTAVSLVSTSYSFGAIEEMLLGKAIGMAFAEASLDATTEYRDGGLHQRSATKVRVPRLASVVDYLPVAAAEAEIEAERVCALTQQLSPLLGSGPYAALFDREEYEASEPITPGVLLYDIDAVAHHPMLGTLTTQIVLSEILRHIRKDENRGRPGMLVIEEAGVLAGSSPHIVSFIQDAWKTFRKLGIACVGLTNEVDDYARKPGSREIWNVSPNKVILRLLSEDLQKALSGFAEAGYPPLIDNAHLGRLIGTLVKKDGVFAQGLWWSDRQQGSFSFYPTGFDYWCAASKPIEVDTVYRLREILGGSFFAAVARLAAVFPQGVRGSDGQLRALTNAELEQLAGGTL